MPRPWWDAGETFNSGRGGGVKGNVRSALKGESNFLRFGLLLALKVKQKTNKSINTFTMKVLFCNTSVECSVLCGINFISIWYHIKTYVKRNFSLLIAPVRKTQNMEMSDCRFQFCDFLYPVFKYQYVLSPMYFMKTQIK